MCGTGLYPYIPLDGELIRREHMERAEKDITAKFKEIDHALKGITEKTELEKIKELNNASIGRLIDTGEGEYNDNIQQINSHN